MIKFGKVFTWGEINKMYPDSWVKIKSDPYPYSQRDKIYVYGVITDEEELTRERIKSMREKDGYCYVGTDGPLARQAYWEWQFIKHKFPCYEIAKQVPTEDGSIVFECELHFYDPEEEKKFYEEEAARQAQGSARREQDGDK